jgi:hypothetical protein
MNGATPYVCRTPGRVDALRAAALESPPRLLNGIEYLEVAPGQRRLEVHFVHPLSLVPAQPLTAAQVEVRGGVRVRDPAVTAVHAAGEVLTVDVATAGDFSTYTLRLVASAGGAAPPPGIDPALAQIEFGFKVGCPSDFDCQVDPACPPQASAAPPIDYLARDYPSFRRLLLDRLAALMPARRERSAADLWVTLAEAVAFRADELAYYQDAVATEAYLGSARQRVSLRRHTRLLDHAFHDGRNARAWVAFEVDAAADGQRLAGADPATGLGGTLLVTRAFGDLAAISAAQAADAVAAGAEPFELVEPAWLFRAHNTIGFHTWSDDECCLPRGATRAFLRDDDAARLRLRAADVLVLESRAGALTGAPADADRTQRHAVRLTRVDPEAPLVDGVRGVPPARRDPVTDVPFVEVEWHAADALPFPLCLSSRIGGVLVGDMAVAVGNVALADHGRSAPQPEPLSPLPGRPDGLRPRYPLEPTAAAPLTQQGRVRRGDVQLPVDAGAPAAAAMRCELADVRPAIEVASVGDERRWQVRRDLLASDGEAAEFVVETENDGRAVLRFGDGVNGRRPPAEGLQARVRTGSGAVGNVGAEAITHVVTALTGIVRVRNPLPATGGLDPANPEQARRDAPQAFRRQERAVTAADYAEVAGRDPRVQRAVATRRWTGSWSTMFLTIDRRGGGRVDAAFEAELAAFVERYRLAGHDVEIDAPRYVPLDLELHVCTRPGHLAADVERRLLDAFGAGLRRDGRPGFFHPDRFSFGEPVHLSALLSAAMAVPGVAHVTPLRFQRLGRDAAGEIDAGRIDIARLEVARLDNDPNAPEFGRLRLDVHAGGAP